MLPSTRFGERGRYPSVYPIYEPLGGPVAGASRCTQTSLSNAFFSEFQRLVIKNVANILISTSTVPRN